MSKEPTKVATWLTASAAGLLLAAGAIAQSPEEYDRHSQDSEVREQHDQRVGDKRKDAKMTSFSELDTDDEGSIAWQDVEDEHEEKLSEANWDQDIVMEQFDADGDQRLSEEEYDSFQTALLAATSDAVAGASAEQSGPQQIDDTLLTMSVDDLTDAEIVNSRGEEIGSVRQVVRDEASGNLSLVVESGGVLGLGANSILVDLAEVSQMSDDQLLWETMLSSDDISEMPEFDDSQYTEVSELDSTLMDAQQGN